MLQEIAKNFRYKGRLKEWRDFGNGHINDSFLLCFETEGEDSGKAILQRINKAVFKNPEELMENILAVTEHLKKKILEEGGDPGRETLNIICARDGKPFYKDKNGDYWRSYVFITDAACYDMVEKEEDFYESAVAFGHFQCLLADYPAETLHETIEGFHDTGARFRAFLHAVKEDLAGRAKYVKDEIDFVKDREELACFFINMIRQNELPLRVTHNDTKLNNIMIDKKTGRALCVIDLDTVMPGLAMNDFGDSIRFGASTGAEDERDLSKVSCDLHLFEVYTRGFLKGCAGRLTAKEISLLPMGAKLMTFECGMRFLTDYLNGDIYFKTDREGHNLDRCRTQFKLVSDMEQKWEEMEDIVRRLSYDS